MGIFGYQNLQVPRVRFGPTNPTPTVAEPSPVQTTLPTSAYGQTIPVIWGKARLPGAYIWVAPIVTVTETHVEWWDTVTTTTSAMTARLRFARPLVPECTWAVRRIWAQGKLIYDNTTGYRAKGLRFRAYDGRSTQGRDPSQTAEEGTNNVSAHRGYLDIVFQNFNIFDIGAPPVFEAEWVMDPPTDAQVEGFQAFFSDPIDTVAAPNWDEQEFYGISNSSGQIRRFSIAGLREIYAIEISGLGRAYSGIEENYLAYIPSLDRLIAFGFVPGPLGGCYPILFDPVTGKSTSEGDAIGDAGQHLNCAASVQIGNAGGVLMASSFNLGYFSVFTFTASSMTRISLSGASWDGRGVPECITVGTIRSSDADVWVCAGSSLWKLVINAQGIVLTTTEFATFTDPLVYAVFHDGNLVVWHDNAQAIKINGTTGATIWTVSVPYQVASAALRGDGSPEQNRFDDTFFAQDTSHYYFTSLDDGTTETLAKGVEVSSWRHVYDALSDMAITTDNVDVPQRRRFSPAGGTDLLYLRDFLTALMVHGS